MPDSLSEQQLDEKERLKKKALKLALKLPAGHISSRTPLQMAVAAALKNKPPKQVTQGVQQPEPVKQSEIDLNNLSPFGLKTTLGLINKDWIHWLPETLWNEFPNCTKETKNKIRAVQTVLTTPDIQFDPHGFYCVVKAFNGEEPDWSIIEPLPCHEIVYAWKQMNLINKLELWPEVEAFIKASMKEEGLTYLPELDISIEGFDTSKLKLLWPRIEDGIEIDLTNPLHVQVARLLDIKRYLASMP